VVSIFYSVVVDFVSVMFTASDVVWVPNAS